MTKFHVHLDFLGKTFAVHNVPAISASEALAKAKAYLVNSEAFKKYCLDLLKTESVAPSNEPPKVVKDIIDFFKF